MCTYVIIYLFIYIYIYISDESSPLPSLVGLDGNTFCITFADLPPGLPYGLVIVAATGTAEVGFLGIYIQKHISKNSHMHANKKAHRHNAVKLQYSLSYLLQYYSVRVTSTQNIVVISLPITPPTVLTAA